VGLDTLNCGWLTAEMTAKLLPTVFSFQPYSLFTEGFSMKRILVATAAAATACLSASSWAAAGENAEVAALRNECAAKNPVKVEAKVQGDNEYQFVYHKGQYRGELTAGQAALACSETQYVAYLNTQDPTRLMSAYPTAAGRPANLKTAAPSGK